MGFIVSANMNYLFLKSLGRILYLYTRNILPAAKSYIKNVIINIIKNAAIRIMPASPISPVRTGLGKITSRIT